MTRIIIIIIMIKTNKYIMFIVGQFFLFCCPQTSDWSSEVDSDDHSEVGKEEGQFPYFYFICRHFISPKLYLDCQINIVRAEISTQVGSWCVKQEYSSLDKTRLDTTRLDKTRLDKTRLDKTRLDKTRSDKIRHVKIRHVKIRHVKIRHDQIRQDNIRQDKIRQDKIRQDNIRQDKIRQDKIRHVKIRHDQIRQDNIR